MNPVNKLKQKSYLIIAVRTNTNTAMTHYGYAQVYIRHTHTEPACHRSRPTLFKYIQRGIEVPLAMRNFHVLRLYRFLPRF